MKREESSIFSSTSPSYLFMFLLFCRHVQSRELQQICSSSCGDIKNINYPFRLTSDPPDCGDPDFELSCQRNKTVLELLSGKYYVKKISYDKRIMRVVDVKLANGSCSLPYKPLASNALDNYFYSEVAYGRYYYASFVNCSGNMADSAYIKVPCLSENIYNVFVTTNGISLSNLPTSCAFISMVPVLGENVENPSYEATKKLLQLGFDLTWSIECRDCLAAGGWCLKISTLNQNYCYKNLYVNEIVLAVFQLSVGVVVVLLTIGRFVFGPIVLLVFLIHAYRKTLKRVDNVEKFLHNQQSWMPKRYSYPEIIAMTNHFQDKLGQGGFGSVYKGQLHTGGLIAVKMLENSKFSGEEFINEVSTIGRIHHVNVVQLLGFCSDGSKRALVYEYMPNGSLDRHIFSKNGEGLSFSFEKLHEIALGTARGIEYLHGGCDVCILHFDIKPHNILLDQNFVPKVSDFGLAKFYPKENDFVSISVTRGTIGYIAPELISRNFGTVSCKSDVYSFGMLLLEMAGGRRNSDMRATRSSKAYFPSWVYERISEGGDLELPNVTEIESVIARKLCIIGLSCIQVKAVDRPSMSKVVEMLEGNIEDLKMPPKPFFSSAHEHISRRETESESSTEWLISESLEECSLNDSFV